MADEKDRKLTPAEEKRMAFYNEYCEKMTKAGYRKTELTVGLVKANLFVILMSLPVIGLFVWLFLRRNPEAGFSISGLKEMILFLVLMVVLVVVHELIHGAAWAIFAENHFRDIEFGFIAQYLTPYATCRSILPKGPYILGALMPLIVLGIIPSVISIFTGSVLLFWLGIVMTLSAGGDVLIVWKLLTYKSNMPEKLFLDHPTRAGLVVFER